MIAAGVPLPVAVVTALGDEGEPCFAFNEIGCVPPFTHSIFTRTAWFMSPYSPCTFKGKPIPLLVHAVPLQLSSPYLFRWHIGGAAKGVRWR